jgi:hypothetical protein
MSVYKAKWPVAVKCATQEAKRIVDDKHAKVEEKARAKRALPVITSILKNEKQPIECTEIEYNLVVAYYLKSIPVEE